MSVIERPDVDLSFAVEEMPAVILTESAAVRIGGLLQERNLPGHALRVFVSGGGCGGMQYGMALEGQPRDYDTIVESGGVRVVIDPTSLQYLAGAQIDYVDNLMGGGFRIENPNAVSTCGCGHSFRTSGSPAASGDGCGHN